MVPRGGHDLGTVACVAGVLVFGVSSVAQPVNRLDAPGPAGELGEGGGDAAGGVQAGDAVHDCLVWTLPVRSKV